MEFFSFFYSIIFFTLFKIFSSLENLKKFDTTVIDNTKIQFIVLESNDFQKGDIIFLKLTSKAKCFDTLYYQFIYEIPKDEEDDPVKCDLSYKLSSSNITTDKESNNVFYYSIVKSDQSDNFLEMCFNCKNNVTITNYKDEFPKELAEVVSIFSKIWLILIIVGSVVFVIIIVSIILCCCCCCKKKSAGNIMVPNNNIMMNPMTGSIPQQPIPQGISTNPLQPTRNQVYNANNITGVQDINQGNNGVNPLISASSQKTGMISVDKNDKKKKRRKSHHHRHKK